MLLIMMMFLLMVVLFIGFEVGVVFGRVGVFWGIFVGGCEDVCLLGGLGLVIELGIGVGFVGIFGGIIYFIMFVVIIFCLYNFNRVKVLLKLVILVKFIVIF